MLFNYSKIKLSVGIIDRAFLGYRKKIFFVLFLGFLAGFSGSIGIGAVMPLFYLLGNSTNTEPNSITQLIQGFFSFFHIPFSLPTAIIFIAVLLVSKAVIQFYAKFINDKTGAEYEEQLRSSLLSKTLHATWPYLLNQKSGYLERIVLNDVSQGVTLISLVSNFILFGTSFVAYAIVALNISATITLLTICFGVLLFLASKPLFSRAKRMGRQVANFEKEVAHLMNQNLHGAKMIKAEGVESQVVDESKSIFKKLRDLRRRMALYQNSLSLVFEPIGFLFIAVLFIFYYQSTNLDIISFGAVVYLVQKMFSFIQSAQNNIHRIYEVAPHVGAVMDYRAQTILSGEELGSSLEPDFQKELNFKEIEFYYEKDRPVLSGVSFSVKRGDMIGIVGSSGSGKTTLGDLLLGLFKPIKGDILMDGQSIKKFNLKSWRKKFSYVSQDVFLLNDTIRNNIRFYDSLVTEQDIIEAAKMAQIHDFIKTLPAGLDTIVGERGLKISGGQRQRIALARALANKPSILILDEATSSLDSESESLIQESIDNLKGKVTVLAIAHRLSTVINSDKLIILEKGRVIEEGIPGELLKDKDSHFYQIYNIR